MLSYGRLGRNVLWNTQRQSGRLCVEGFNVANRSKFQVSLTLLTSVSGRAGSAEGFSGTATTSRRIQLALKWMF